MWYVIAAIAGACAGGLVGWFSAISRSAAVRQAAQRELERHNAELTARLDESQKRIAKVETDAKADFELLRKQFVEQSTLRATAESDRDNALTRVKEERQFLEQARETLKDTFGALASASLNESSRQFLDLAKTKFDEVLAEAKGDLNNRQDAIQRLISPIFDTLKEFDKQVRDLETKREGAYSGIVKHMENVTSLQEGLRKETGNLAAALRSPQVRGRWGELQLRRTVELAGMTEHCEFQEQVSVQTDTGAVRPDLVITLPDGRKILIDSKVPLESYLSAHEATQAEEQHRLLTLHAARVKEHMRALAKRNYTEYFGSSAGFVVMFIPVESSLSDALRLDPSIYEEGLERGVHLVTPSTLMTMLKSAALAWRQDAMAKNAEKISELGRKMHSRVRTLAEHFAKVGIGLSRATKAYNEAVRSLETHVLSSARKFQEFGAVPAGNDIPAIESIDATPQLPHTEASENDDYDETRTTPFRARGNEG